MREKERGVSEPGAYQGHSRSGGDVVEASSPAPRDIQHDLEEFDADVSRESLTPKKRFAVEHPCLSAGRGPSRERRRKGASYCGAPDCTGPNGSKGCRACHAAYMRSWRAARRALKGDSDGRS